MRDEQIIAMNEANTRRVYLLLRQFEFLNTRNLALEHSIVNKWSLLKAIFNPLGFIKQIDGRQKELLAACAEAERKAKVQPSIIKVGGNGHG